MKIQPRKLAVCLVFASSITSLVSCKKEGTAEGSPTVAPAGEQDEAQMPREGTNNTDVQVAPSPLPFQPPSIDVSPSGEVSEQ